MAFCSRLRTAGAAGVACHLFWMMAVARPSSAKPDLMIAILPIMMQPSARDASNPPCALSLSERTAY
jgi:hypothetical protein